MKKSFLIKISLVILGTILYFAANLQRIAIPGAIFDLLQTDLHTTAQNIASLGTSFMYIYAISQLVIGVLIAKYGGFRVISVASILFFSGSILFPFADNFTLLYTSRMLMGCGSAAFYLGLINEIRNLVPKKNFEVILSVLLFIGYLGGIIANAPLVITINHLGWRYSFFFIGIITAIVAILFILLNKFSDNQKINKSVHLDLKLYKETLQNKKNINLYLFACINYSLYYVMQTIIGKKFLEDFCLMSTIGAATILSIMGALYAIGGSLFAVLSKVFLTRRTIFLKLSALNTLFVFSIIFICLTFNIHTKFIGYLFCTISLCASLSPLLIALLHDINDKKLASTSVSVMTCGFFAISGILGNIIGICLDACKTQQIAYLSIFGIILICAIFSFINVFKVGESTQTKRIIKHIQYVREKINKYNENNDDYDNNIYTDV